MNKVLDRKSQRLFIYDGSTLKLWNVKQSDKTKEYCMRKSKHMRSTRIPILSLNWLYLKQKGWNKKTIKLIQKNKDAKSRIS